jgi:hypothetical protein
MLSLRSIDHRKGCLLPCTDGDWEKGLQELALVLRKCDTFYDAIGGLIGYQLKVS